MKVKSSLDRGSSLSTSERYKGGIKKGVENWSTKIKLWENWGVMGVSSVTAVMVVNLTLLASELGEHRGHSTYGPPVKGGQRAHVYTHTDSE